MIKKTYVNRRIIIHAAYTSILFLVGFLLYDSGTTLRLYLSNDDYFKNNPIIMDVIVRFMHITGVFIFDIIIVYFIYKFFSIIY